MGFSPVQSLSEVFAVGESLIEELELSGRIDS